MEFGEKLRKLRNEKGLTQKYVAKELKITPRAYASYELENIRPRKRETYDKLADVLGCDVNYLLVDDSSPKGAAWLSAAAANGGASALIAGVMFLTELLYQKTTSASNKLQKDSDPNRESDQNAGTDEIIKDNEMKQKKFRATALGIIVMALTQKGIKFQLGKVETTEKSRAKADEFVIVHEQNIDEWWFRFWARSRLDDMLGKYQRFRANSLFSSFCTALPDPNRKVSIVINDESLLDEFLKYQSGNSYRGNMSVILIDVDNARIVKEELLSSFNIDDTEDKLSIL